MTVLGGHLYSTPAVAVRELVQNAHDSITRRRIEDPAFSGGRIDVTSDPRTGTLTVSDDGAGMTREEIDRFLATVGVGYTRGLRERSDELIGQFGLGFLSAFIIGERTVVRTASYQAPDAAHEYTSTTGERYSVEPCAERPVGTEVVLKLTADHRELADPAVLAGIVGRYCALLGVPVQVNGEPVNADAPPWRATGEAVAVHPVQARKQALAFAERMDPSFRPLCTLEVDGGGVRGLLWLQDVLTYGSWDNRRLAVYVRGMLLDDDARDLLPRWAGFVSGAVESDVLTPTASREDLQRDDAWEAARAALHEALVSGLARVASEQPEAWSRVLARHNEGLLGAALADEGLEALLAADLRVPTSEGELTVRELVDGGDGRAHVGLGTGGFEEMRFRALKRPIATGTRYAVVPFVRRWCARHGVDVVELGTSTGDRALFQRVELEEAGWLAEQLAKERQELIPARFEPVEMPFVLVPDREAELKARLEADAAQERIASAALHLARSHTATIDGTYEARLYVNVDSPAIAALLQARRDGRDVEVALGLLRAVLALMAAGERETRAGVDLLEALSGVGDAVRRLL
ncbi:ATP-binding protein [Solirubrobacter phytolaccae]